MRIFAVKNIVEDVEGVPTPGLRSRQVQSANQLKDGERLLTEEQLVLEAAAIIAG